MNQPQYSSEAGGGLAALGGVGGNGPPQLPLSDLEKSSARKVRKEAEKQRKQAKKYEEQLKKIRGPKSQKIQIIDESFLEKYNHAQTLPPGPSLKTKKRSKKTPSEMVQLNLSDCLRDRLSLAEKGELGPGGELKTVLKPVVPIAITQPIVFHKGKQREVPKEKRLTKLKKDILNNRKAKQDEGAAPVAAEVAGTESSSPQSVAEEVAQPSQFTNGPKLGESPFLKAIERCCSTDGGDVVPPSVGSEEYQNGFPALNDTVAKVPDKEKGVQHSRAFRAYCDHLITDELRSHAETLVTKLFQFQTNAYGKNPIKAVSNKRYCVGFNEILKYLETRKLKLVLIAPDLEPNDSIDQLVERVKTICRQTRVPIVFGVKRRKLGFHLLKKVPVSCVGVLSYSGADDTVKRLLELAEQERVNLRAQLAGGH
ncbi:selenocysteine insertion sequence-binding protein 2 [Culex pipiens pallens]|uniref:selenocysteine insertion sequence-binding protein 2 n=1 Tax=Culex pipiens pallens TaxID=42434 RepID=UPI0019530FE0|nr:selenocysteine insertion sequence-binding protein 2 [Culex pipiens pallens]